MLYIKLVDRTSYGEKAREYRQYEDLANLAIVVCDFALERQISPRHVLCQVYNRKSWLQESKEHDESIRNSKK